MTDITENRTVAKRYLLLKKIGDGGMGNIFLADDLQLSRQVAVKTIRRELKENTEVRKRIDRECNLHATLGVHPNIIALHDKIVEDDDIFLIMEYVEGETLTAYLKKSIGEKTQQQLQERIDIVCQVLEALAHIHANDILHRDIKPSNIILSRKNTSSLSVKLMDFGIASLEREDSALTQLTTLDTGGPGTPTYMAPERIDSTTFGESGPPTDLYSVGVILYELLGNSPPFQGTMTEVFTGHLAKQPNLSLLPASIPDALANVLKKSLEKEQSQRFQNAREFATALRAIDFATKSGGYKQVTQTEESLEQTLLATDIQREAMAEAVARAKASTGPSDGMKLLAVCLGALCLAGLVWGGWYFLKPANEDIADKSSATAKEANVKDAVDDEAKQTTSGKTTSDVIAADPESINTKEEEVVINPFESPVMTPSTTAATSASREPLTPTLGQHPYSVPVTPAESKSSALSAFNEQRQKVNIDTSTKTTPVSTTVSTANKSVSKKAAQSTSKTPAKSTKEENSGWKIIDNRTEKVN
jgi:serine/threonine protein kinase